MHFPSRSLTLLAIFYRRVNIIHFGLITKVNRVNSRFIKSDIRCQICITLN
jgi:hypothetical protein